MRILVTGGAGYIGSVLVPSLLANGYEVTVLDSFMYGQPSLAYCCVHEGLTIIRGDARDEETLRPLVARADILIPLAAIVGAPACEADEVAAHTVNYRAVVRLCHLSSREQLIIFPNTNSGLGVGGQVECDENSPLKPISSYGVSKVRAEGKVLSRGNGIVFRLATVFGCSPRMRTDLLVNEFVERACLDRAIVLFEPDFRRNFVHIRDVASAFLHAIENRSDMADNIYNCGDTRANMSKIQLCAKIKDQVPNFEWFIGAGHDKDRRDYIVSNAKLEATGWKPRHTIEDGITELVKFYTMVRKSRYGNV